MEHLDTKPYEVSPVNGLSQFSGVNAEPTWIETPQIHTKVSPHPSEPSISASPFSFMQASSEEFCNRMLQELSELTSQNGVRQRSMLEKFNEALEFEKFVDNEFTKYDNSSDDIAIEQLEVEQFDEDLPSNDKTESEGSTTRAFSSSDDVDLQLVLKEPVPGVTSMDQRSDIAINSTQDIASSYNIVTNEFNKTIEQRGMSQLIDPQLQAFQLSHFQQLNSSQQYPAPQQPHILQYHMIPADVDHHSGTPSRTMTSLAAAQSIGTVSSGVITSLPQSQPSQGSSQLNSNVISCYMDPPLPSTRQEQLWRSQPQGPYYLGTQIPKKVVRNCFLNEWLSMHRPGFPLPNSSGQGFMEQNRVFGSLSYQEQLAVNAYVVRKVEAEQAEKRRQGVAKYRDVDVKTGKGSGYGVPKSFASSVTQNPTNGTLLGRRIAPAPTEYNRQGGAPNGAFKHQSNNPSIGSFQVYVPKFQAPMQQGLYNQYNSYANRYHAHGGVSGIQYRGPIASQTSSGSGIQGSQGPTYANPAMAYNQHGCPSSQQGNPTAMMQGGGHPIFGYLGSMRPDYSHNPYINQHAGGPQSYYPYSVNVSQPTNGLPSTAASNLGTQSALDSASRSSIDYSSFPMTSASSFARADSARCSTHHEDEDEEGGKSSGRRAIKRARRT